MAKKVESKAPREAGVSIRPKVVVANTAAEQRSGKKGYITARSISDDAEDSNKSIAIDKSNNVVEPPFVGGEEALSSIKLSTNNEDKQKSLELRLAKIREEDPEGFDRAILRFGFARIADSMTRQGWIRTSALPPKLAEERRIIDAQRNKKYREQLSPEKAAARTAQKVARQKVRRMEKRRAPEPT